MTICLIIDDYSVDRQVASCIAQRFGLETIALKSQEALDYCYQNMPELILLDLNMPDLNGISFLKALRAQENGDKPYVVMYTSSDIPHDIHNSAHAGSNAYLVKPITTKKFQKLLDKSGISVTPLNRSNRPPSNESQSTSHF